METCTDTRVDKQTQMNTFRIIQFNLMSGRDKKEKTKRKLCDISWRLLLWVWRKWIHCGFIIEKNTPYPLTRCSKYIFQFLILFLVLMRKIHFYCSPTGSTLTNHEKKQKLISIFFFFARSL